MIPRYTRPEIARIWAPENKFRIWFEIEALACEAQARLGVVPRAAARLIRELGSKPYTPERVARIEEIERTTQHDVIAFTTELTEQIGEVGRYVHLGMTSSDVLDTCLAVQLVEATDVMVGDLNELLAVLSRRAWETKDLVAMGRSHGIHAEPVTIGLKFAGFHAEFQRARQRLIAARTEIATCAISGAVGTFAHLAPAVEAHVAKSLGLVPETISTQVIPRDRHAMYFATLAVIGASIERIATEIRNLQRTEVGEAEEYFSPGQKGSSAMPHKRNPVLSENLVGQARLLRGYALPALEDVALWHERDISHSSVERIIAPDATATLDFALARLTRLIDRLVIHEDQVTRNVELLGGLPYSGEVLLALVAAGLSREDAYALVQGHAMAAWSGEGRFADRLKADPAVTRLVSADELDKLFDPARQLKQVDLIFRRVFGPPRERRTVAAK